MTQMSRGTGTAAGPPAELRGPEGTTAPAGEGTDNNGTDLDISNPEQAAASRNALLIPIASAVSNDDRSVDQSQKPSSLEQEFERKYDDLGPVDFAKQVIQFGDWLGRAGANLSPEEKQRALAEYSFLQNRLSLWLGYDYKPPKGYVEEAKNYVDEKEFDVKPADIKSKTLYLAIPEYTSPAQWREILRAIIYGKDNGVSVVITRIRQ
jgi:hypothetical protein